VKHVLNKITTIYEDIFQPATPEELAGRDKDRVKVFVQELIEREDCTKNNDGSYSFTGNIDLNGMNLTALPIKFGTVDGHFYCSGNELTSLEGAPSTVGRYFSCSNNQLTSLEGAPSTIGGDFSCSYNQLTSLVGAPSTIGGYFRCSYNQLTSLVGAPSTVGRYFSCRYNKVKFTEEDVRKVSNVKGEIIV
jgi:hypothetical protein